MKEVDKKDMAMILIYIGAFGISDYVVSHFIDGKYRLLYFAIALIIGLWYYGAV